MPREVGKPDESPSSLLLTTMVSFTCIQCPELEYPGFLRLVVRCSSTTHAHRLPGLPRGCWTDQRFPCRRQVQTAIACASKLITLFSKASRWTLFWASVSWLFEIPLNIILPSAWRSHKLSLPLGSGTSFCTYSSPFSRVQYVLCIVYYFQKHKITYATTTLEQFYMNVLLK